MALGLIGQKCGMTRIFSSDGRSVPVTVIQVQPNYVSQIKNVETNGYSAVQLTGGGTLAAHRVPRSTLGHYAKAGLQPGRFVQEFRVEDEQLKEFELGSAVEVSHFEEGQKVDVVGVTKGKGFAGAVKRHNFSMQDATHGNSLSHRALGSTGQCQSPGRVFKGKKMAGQMGDVRRTAQGLEVIKVDLDRHLLLVKGAVPGAPEGMLVIKKSVKSKGDQ